MKCMKQAWVPPSHWSKSRRDAHARSLEFLETIVGGSTHMKFGRTRHGMPTVLIQGVSRRWYRIETGVYRQPEYLEGYGSVDEVSWNINVMAGAWKSDIINKTPHMVSLCIKPQRQNLPIGDQIGALALSLRNDRSTAMRIPLLAQFLVSYRDALKEVHQFTEDGVMHEDFDGGIGDIADIYEDYYLMPCDEPTPSAHEFWQDLFIQHEIEEEWSLDQMFLDHIEQSLTEKEVPWHHNEERVWMLEADLLDGRR
jgi:hypothetical protein